jgi:hypothetical protein
VLDANHLSARGCLEPGLSSTVPVLLGSPFGSPPGSPGVVTTINLRAEAGHLYLSWHGPIIGREGVDEVIPIDRMPRHFGGLRAFFLCPGVGCGRRVTKLHLIIRQQPECPRFLCRQCSQLAYESQSEAPRQRALRRACKRAHRLRQRFGIVGPGIAGIDVPLPAKPRTMTLDAYAWRLEEVLQAEIQANEACTDWLQRLVARVGNSCGSGSTKPRFTL